MEGELVKAIAYQRDPADMWTAQLAFAPRQKVATS